MPWLELSRSRNEEAFWDRDSVRREEKGLSWCHYLQPSYLLSYFSAFAHVEGVDNFKNSEYQLDENDEEFWNHYVSSAKSFTTIILSLNSICIFVFISSLVFVDSLARDDATKSLIANESMCWLVINGSIILAFHGLIDIPYMLGHSIKFTMALIGKLIIFARILLFVYKIMWLGSNLGGTLMDANSLNKLDLSIFGFHKFLADTLQIGILCTLPIPWPWAFVFLSFELGFKIFSVLVFVHKYNNDAIFRDVSVFILISLVMLYIYSCASALHRELKVKSIFSHSKREKYLSEQKLNFISLLCNEIRVPLHLINSGYVEAGKGFKSYQKLQHKLQGSIQIISILADNILFLAKYEEGRVSKECDANISIQHELAEILEYPTLTTRKFYKDLLKICVSPKMLTVETNRDLMSLLLVNVVHLCDNIVAASRQLHGDVTSAKLPKVGITITHSRRNLDNNEGSDRDGNLSILIEVMNNEEKFDMKKQSGTLHWIVSEIICTVFEGTLKCKTDMLLMEFPVQLSLVKEKENVLMRYDSDKFSLNSDIRDISDDNQLDDKKEIPMFGIISSDPNLDICLREILEEILESFIQGETDKVHSFSESQFDTSDSMSMLKNYQIIFSDSSSICVALLELGFTGFLVHFSGGYIYKDEPKWNYCDFKLSIPCLGDRRVEFEDWMYTSLFLFQDSNYGGTPRGRLVRRSFANTSSRSLDEKLSSWRTTEVKPTRLPRSSLILPKLSSWKLPPAVHSFFQLADYLMLAGMPKLDDYMHNIYHKWMFIYSYSPIKTLAHTLECVSVLGACLSHIAFDNPYAPMIIVYIFVSTVALIGGYIDRYVIKPKKLMYRQVWFVLGLLIMFSWLIMIIRGLVFYSMGRLTFNSFTKQGFFKNQQEIDFSHEAQSVIMAFFSSLTRLTIVPFPWNCVMILLSILRSLIVVNMLFSILHTSRATLSLLITLVSCGVITLFDSYRIERSSRVEFILFRKQKLSAVFLDRCVNLWGKESIEPIKRVLDLRNELLSYRCELYGNSVISVEYVKKWNTLLRGFNSLQHLYYIMVYKILSNGFDSNSSEGDSFGADISTQQLYSIGDSIFVDKTVKLIIKNVCNSLDLDGIDICIVTQVDAHVKYIRSNDSLFQAVFAFALNRVALFVKSLDHNKRQFRARSHQVIVNVLSEDSFPVNFLKTPGQVPTVKKFTDARLMTIQIIHEADTDNNLSFFRQNSSLIGQEIYQNALKFFAQQHHHAEIDEKIEFCSTKLVESKYVDRQVVHTIHLLYFLLPKPLSLERIVPSTWLDITQTGSQQRELAKYGDWRFQIQRYSETGPKKNNKRTFKVGSTHLYSVLFISCVYDTKNELITPNDLDNSKMLEISFKNHWWKCNTVSLEVFTTSPLNFHDYDAVLIDSLVASDKYNMLTNITVEKLMLILHYQGFIGAIFGLQRSNVPFPTHMIDSFDKVVSAPMTSKKLEELSDECCRIKIFGKL